MKIRIQSIHFNADQKLLDFINDKVDKLVHYYDHIIEGEVFLRLDNASDLQNKIVQIKLQIPGNDLITKYQCRTFEEATDLCIESLSKQIIRHKEKLRGE